MFERRVLICEVGTEDEGEVGAPVQLHAHFSVTDRDIRGEVS